VQLLQHGAIQMIRVELLLQGHQSPAIFTAGQQQEASNNDDAYTTQLHKLSQAVLDAKLQVIEFTSEHSQAQQQTKKQKVDSDDE
jgi:hypothetical protein